MFTGKEGKVYFDNNEIEILTWSMDATRPIQNVSNSGSLDGWAEYEKVGTTEFSGTFEGYIESGLYPDVGDTVNLDLEVDTYNYYNIEAIITAMHTTTEINGVIALSYDFQGSGNLYVVDETELIANGLFVNNTIWTFGAGWSHDAVNGEADHTAGSVLPLTQGISTEVNEHYQIAFQIKNATAGYVTVNINGVYVINSGTNNQFNLNQSYTRKFIANKTGSVTLSITPSTTFNGSIDNVSIKKLTYRNIE